MTPNVTTDDRSTVYGARVLVDERGREHRYDAIEEQMTVLDDAGRVGGQYVDPTDLPTYVDAVRERDGIAELYVTDGDGWAGLAESLAEIVAERERPKREGAL